MIRVLVVGGLFALLLAGSVAWADEPEPPPPPADIDAEAPPPPPPPPAPPADAVPVAPPASGAREGPYAPPPRAPDLRPVVPCAPVLEGPYAPTPRDLSVDVTPEMVLEALPAEATERVCSPWSGSARLRYRLRTTDEEDTVSDTDQDLYAYLKLKYRDEALPGLSGSFHGRLTVDLDDFGNANGFNVFDSITDTYSDRWNARLYHAYVNYRFCNLPVQSVRLGRMWLDVGEFVTVDGLRIESARTTAGCLGIAGFVGKPVYLYEGYDSGDFVGGLQLIAQPWESSEIQVDWTYIEDENVYGDVDNSLLRLLWNQRFGSYTVTRFEYQHLDDEARLLRAMVDSAWLPWDLAVRAHFNTLINPQAQLVYDLDYFYWVALDLEPYWDGHLSASKALGECFDVEGGFTIRRLYDEADEGRYNREFEQYYLAGSTYDWLAEGLSLTLSGEWWNSDDDIWTVVFDVEYRPSRCWRFVLGTDYAAYRYDLWADDERQNVYSVFGRASWRPSPRWTFDLRLRLEDDDFGTYTTLDATAQLNF